MKINLGFKPRYGMPVDPDTQDEPDEPQEVYPSMSVEGEAGVKLSKKLEAGDEFTATVKFKVVGISDRVASSVEYGGREDRTSLDLEVMEIDRLDINSDDEPEPTAEDAVDSYRQSKK